MDGIAVSSNRSPALSASSTKLRSRPNLLALMGGRGGARGESGRVLRWWRRKCAVRQRTADAAKEIKALIASSRSGRDRRPVRRQRPARVWRKSAPAFRDQPRGPLASPRALFRSGGAATDRHGGRGRSGGHATERPRWRETNARAVSSPARCTDLSKHIGHCPRRRRETAATSMAA